MAATPAPAKEPDAKGNTPLPDGIYRLSCASNASMTVDIPGFSTKIGEKPIVYSFNGGNNQYFELTATGGYYRIRSVSSADVLAVQGGLAASGTPIIQTTNTGAAAERFAIVKNADGSYSIYSKLGAGDSKINLALSVSPKSMSTLSLANVSIPASPAGSPASPAANQKFKITKVTAMPIKAGQLVEITPSSATGKRVDVNGVSRAAGATVSVWQANGGLNQKFEVVKVSADVFAFRALHSGRLLTADGTALVQGSASATPSKKQSFQVIRCVGGGFQLKNLATGTILTTGKDGTLTLQAPSTAKAANTFSFATTHVLEGSGYYYFYTQSGTYISVSSNSLDNGARLALAKKSSANSLIWSVAASANSGYTKLQNGASKRDLDVSGCVANSTVDLIQWASNSGKNQRWTLVPAGGGWFYLKSGIATYVASSNGDTAAGALLSSTPNMAKALKVRFTAAPAPTPYNGSYIDLNLTTQKVMIIRDGVKIFESDVVTGRPSMPTPTGTFHIMNKLSPANLVGPTWNSWVQYWAQFTPSACGFHDAYWQSSFGLARWQAGYGSHGCVNLPLAKAKEFYGLVKVGDTVISHY